MSNKIEELEKLIQYHQEKYYNEQPEISDLEFDELVDELRKLNPESEVLKKVGAPISFSRKWKKTEHSAIMGSLNKVSVEDFESWMEKCHLQNDKGSTKFIVTEKYDGISIALYYEKGKLVHAVTRGDGSIGEDILENVLKMQGTIPNLRTDFSGWFRGEIVMLKEDFKKVNSISEKQFSNPRNATAGIARGYDGNFCEYLKIFYYDISKDWTLEKKLDFINKEGFSITNFYVFNTIWQFKEIYEAYLEHRNNYNYQMDGLVISVDDFELKEKMGYVDNRPKGMIAVKFPAQEVGTRLLDVEWNVTRTGRVNPRAKLQPVEIDGSVVEYATLHNIGYIENLDLRIDDLVSVKKAGDIIPAITSVLVSGVGVKVEAPEFCPVCNYPLTIRGAYIFCENPNCTKKNLARIIHYCNILELDNISSGIIEKLFDAGIISEIWHLYEEVTKDKLMAISGIGEKIADNFLNELRNKSKISLHRFILSLGMDGLSDKNAEIFAKFLKKAHPTIVTVFDDNIANYDLFTPQTTEKIKKSLNYYKWVICHMLNYVTLVEEQSTSNILNGKSFCITGTLMGGSRENYIKLIKQNGGEYKTGVSKGLTYLVTNDTESGSSKNKKAKELGIEVINESQLINLLKENKNGKY